MASRLLAVGEIGTGYDSQSILDFEDVFSGDYPAYEIFLTNLLGRVDNMYINANLIDASGSVLSDSNYHWQSTSVRDSSTTQSSAVGNSVAFWSVGRPSGSSTTQRSSTNRLVICSPFESNSFTTFFSEQTGWNSQTAYFYTFGGNYKNAVSCTGIRFSSEANSTSGDRGIFGGSVRIYGIGG